MKKKLLVIGVICLLAGGYFYFQLSKVPKVESSTASAVRNLIGTRTGSTTVYVGFYAKYAASTTYPIYIGGNVDEAVFSFSIGNASSSAGIILSVLGSFDTDCETATTSTTANNQLLKSEVRWFDAYSHIKNAAALTSLTNSTSTIGWVNPAPGLTRELILTDLDMQCVAIEVNASSTTLQVRTQLKEFK